MQVGKIPRNDWYDRNCVVGGVNFNALVGPHAGILRATYTVPAGKKTLVDFIEATGYRVTAAGPSGIIALYGMYTPSGGAGRILYRHWTDLPAVNATYDKHLNSRLLMQVGDTIDMYTLDSSTGGTVSHYGLINTNEFDV